MTDRTVLLTGGTGYIGSHTAVALDAAGFTPVIVDNLSNSRAEVLDAIGSLSKTKPAFYQGDVRDTGLLRRILRDHGVGAVIHFAALKSVAESVANPLAYFDNNVSGLISLLSAMKDARVSTLVYSSSATVYGQADVPAFSEDDPVAPVNPYGQSKAMGETILRALHAAEPNWCVSILRYFNPVGAHESGIIGENPLGVPNNLFPYLTQVATGVRPHLTVFGNDYPTHDGTCIRDYIHVMDVAEAHVRALEHLQKRPRCETLNIGTGRGSSVLEVVRAYANALGRDLPHIVGPRRAGDVPCSCANPARAKEVMAWEARRDLHTMCTDTVRWQKKVSS